MQQGYRRYVPENPKHISALVIYSAPIHHFVFLSNKSHLKLNIVLFLFYFFFFFGKQRLQQSWFIHCLALKFWNYLEIYVLKVTIISFTLFYIYIIQDNQHVSIFKRYRQKMFLSISLYTHTHKHKRALALVYHRARKCVTCGNTTAKLVSYNGIMYTKLSLRWFVSWIIKSIINIYICVCFSNKYFISTCMCI
jgi:hypothetical protein